MIPSGRGSLAATSHYQGPKPGHIEAHGPKDESAQINDVTDRLKAQIRAYAGLIQTGDRIGIIVPRKEDRYRVLRHLEHDPALVGKSQIIRARNETGDGAYSPEFDPDKPITILTVPASKGLEFRAAHWLFCDISMYYTIEHYYTVVTRAKTRLDLYYETKLPQAIAQSYSPPVEELW